MSFFVRARITGFCGTVLVLGGCSMSVPSLSVPSPKPKTSIDDCSVKTPEASAGDNWALATPAALTVEAPTAAADRPSGLSATIPASPRGEMGMLLASVTAGQQTTPVTLTQGAVALVDRKLVELPVNPDWLPTAPPRVLARNVAAPVTLAATVEPIGGCNASLVFRAHDASGALIATLVARGANTPGAGPPRLVAELAPAELVPAHTTAPQPALSELTVTNVRAAGTEGWQPLTGPGPIDCASAGEGVTIILPGGVKVQIGYGSRVRRPNTATIHNQPLPDERTTEEGCPTL